MSTVELRKRTGLVRVLPEGAKVCGWCAEFEDAARQTAAYALRVDELERKNDMLHEAVARIARQLRENNCDEVERLKEELRYANGGWCGEPRFSCPLCRWRPKQDAPSPLRSLKAHLRVKHGARNSRLKGEEK